MEEILNKIYEHSSYVKEAETCVTSCERSGDVYKIELADTIFFPNEGGQNADIGKLSFDDKVVSVLDGEIVTSEAEGKRTRVVYTVSDEVAVGTKVKMILDWDMRYEHMQNHSGEHVITGIIHNTYGFNNVGFHLSDNGPVTLDIDGELSFAQVMEMEKAANEVIYRNLSIIDKYPTKEECSKIDYRCKIDILGQVRLIQIGDDDSPIDVCACCAPHVKSTGEIGIIKVISVSRFKKGTQIAILCGRRALEYINHCQQTLTDIASLLTTHPDNILEIVNSYREEIGALKSELSELREKEIIDNLVKMGATESHVIFTDLNLSPANMKNIFNALTEHFDDYVGIFVGTKDSGYRYYAGSKTLDTSILATRMKNELDAKGGGKGVMLQGRVEADEESIRKCFISS